MVLFYSNDDHNIDRQKTRLKSQSSNIKLEVLAIQIHSFIHFNSDLLNELHECGFYRRLHISIDKIWDQREFDKLTTVNGIVKLSSWENDVPSLSLLALKNLEQLDIFDSTRIANFKQLPHSLVNLERIGFLGASIDDIMPFVRRSVAMQKIKIDFLDRKGEETGVIDLLALNREREQLLNAQKITLYVSEQFI